MFYLFKKLRKFNICRCVISVLVTLSIIASAFAGINLLAAGVQDIWDGTVSAPLNGNGSPSSPYEISKGSELAFAISNGGEGKHYKLTSDIYLNDIEKIDWKTGEAIGDYQINSWYNNQPFSGTIDGNGHTVFGIYYKENIATGTMNFGYEGAGLIPRVNNGESVTISKLGVDNSYIYSKNSASAFVGFIGRTWSGDSTPGTATVKIDCCYVGSDVTLTSNFAGAFLGGNRDASLEVKNSYSLATTKAYGSGLRYGLIGNRWGTAIKLINVYNANGPIITESHSAVDVTIANAYETEASPNFTTCALLTKADMKGEDVFENPTKMPALNTDSVFTAGRGYPTLTVFGFVDDGGEDDKEEEDTSVIWDGETKTAPSKGEGSKNSPYEIERGSQLAYAIANGGQGKYYKLTSDIYLNDIEKIDWETGEAIGNYKINNWFYNKPFSGTINGNGHTVYGLYYKDDVPTGSMIFGYAGAGLIPRVNVGESVKLTALGVDKAYIYGINGAAALVGFAGMTYNYSETKTASVIIDQCYVGADVIITANFAGAFLGGNRNVILNVSDSYSLAQTKAYGNGARYGLVGNMWSSVFDLSNVYNANGPILTENWNATAVTIANAYETVDSPNYPIPILLEKENMKGMDVFTNENKMLLLNKNGMFIAGDEYPVLAVFSGGSGTEPPQGEKEGDIWTGKIANSFEEGEGTKQEPYIIKTGAELAYAVKSNGLGEKYFKLGCDIYLNDVSTKGWYNSEANNHWVSANNFMGYLDGDGHIVYGIWYPENAPDNAAGLVSSFGKGYIKNIGVRYAQIYAQVSAGGIVGDTKPGALKQIDSCFTDETVTIQTRTRNSGAGGILGNATDMTNSAEISLEISNCYSKANISAVLEERQNGIIGTAWRTPYTLKNCYSIGSPPYFASSGAICTSAYWNYDISASVDEVRAGKSLSDYISGNYSDAGSINEWTLFTRIEDDSQLRGENAKISMPDLDYEGTYQTVSGGTPKLKIFASISGEDIFSSKEADFYGEGKGTREEPFIIKTVEHLRYLVESIDTFGKYYKLANDIYINDTTNSDWTLNNPSVWYSHADRDAYFAGTLDGDGHSIYGIFVNEKPNPTAEQKKANYISHATGLFPYVYSNATIRNLHIRNSYISGKGCVGAFAGTVVGVNDQKMQFIGCSVDESVSLHGYTVGGIIGAGDKRVDLMYCYSTAKLSTDGAKLNGLIGDIWSAKVNIAECYTVGYPAVGAEISTDYALYGTVEQNKTTLVTILQMTGENAKKYMPDFDWNKVWYTVDGKTPRLKVIPYGGEFEMNNEGEKGRVWSGKTASGFASGSGTKDAPYIIETPEQLAYLMNETLNKGYHYKLGADIRLNDTSSDNWENNAKEWYSGNASFKGIFDGNGYVVSGMYFKTFKGEKAGLFQRISCDSVIKRVGVTESTIINVKAGAETYAAAIVAYVDHWEPDNNPDKKAPLVSECFANDSVYVEAKYAGGIVCGAQTLVEVENCYFTGELSYEKVGGGLVGNSWAGDGHGPSISTSYCATADRDSVGQGNGFSSDSVFAGKTVFNNVYVDGVAVGDNIKSLSILYMKGDYAKEKMSGFDWNNVWRICPDGTPVLRCFKNAEKYASHREPVKMEIAFVTNGGSKCDSIFGFPGYTEITPDMIPIPERYGYEFEGWYHFSSLKVPFDMDYFPNYDIILYAKWKKIGFTVTFEQTKINEKYDVNSGAEHFKPGISGYSPKYFHDGLKSMHAKGDSDIDPMFLLSYEDTVEVGKEYELTFWMNTDTDGISGSVELIHANYGDVNDEFAGYEEVLKFDNLKANKWQEYKAVFVANAPYLVIKTPAGKSLYFDDFQVVPTGKTGETGKIIAVGNSKGNNSALKIALGIAATSAVIIAMGALAVIFIKKKKAKV